jgi:hypothetical protein
VRAAFIAAAAALSLAACASTGAGSGPIGGSGRFSAQGAGIYLSPEQTASFSKQVERDLAAKGARLAIVFRTGETRDQLPDGISYTHGAFWVFAPITLDDGRKVNGYAVYNLYHGDGKTLAMDKSYLHQDFPLDFVAPTAVDDVAVIIPTPEMQRRVLAIMDSPTYRALHIEPYSLVSNPHDIKYQNCTEFMLDVVASAAWNTTDMPQIKANLKQHFTPTKVKTSLIERMLAPLAATRIKTDDQGGTIVTATYESMSAFMKDNGLLNETYILRRQADPARASAQ